MQLKDNNEMVGALVIELRDENGVIKETRTLKNLVVSTGRALIAARMCNNSSNFISHMAVGTGAVAPALGDTVLGAEAARVALTSATPSGNVATYVATFGAGVGTGALTEAGLFNAVSAGTLACRVTFSVVNKAAGDSMTITWTLTNT